MESSTLCRLLVVLAVCALSAPLRAQEASPEPTEQPAEPEPNQPAAAASEAAEDAEDAAEDAAGTATAEQEALLRNTHITELAQETRRSLQLAQPLLRTDSDVARIARVIEREEAEMARLTHPTRLAQIDRLSQRELADLRQEWRRYHERYRDWKEPLGARALALEEVRTQLVALRRTWRDLRDADEAVGGAEGRRERILSSLEAVRVASTALEEERDVVVALEDRVSELMITTDDVADRIRDALAAYRERLFVRDRAPLWQGLGEDIVHEGDEGWSERVRLQGALLLEQASSMFRLLMLFAVLAGLMVLLERRKRAWPDAPELVLAQGIVGRPIAAALVIVLFVSPVVVNHAPVLFGDAVAIVVLLPLAWLITPLLPTSVRPLVGFLIALVIVDRMEGTMSDGSAMRRLVVLGESLIAALVLALWVRQNFIVEGRATRWTRALAVSGAIVFAGGFLANVLGYAFLATMLVRGVVFSLNAALLLATTVAIADALVTVALHSEAAKHLHGVRLFAPLILGRTRRLLVIAAVVSWCALALAGFGLATPFESWLTDALEHEYTFGSVEISIGGFLAAIAVLFASWALMRALIFVLDLDLLPRLKLEPGVDGAISGLTRYLVMGGGILLSLAVLGIDASQLALIAGALGVGVGFGLQGIVANFIAGLVLMLERPVRLGDRIEVGLLIGRVQRIGLRSSTVLGEDGAEVIVPNEILIGREVVNWTLSDRRRRVQLAVGVAYETDPQFALSVIQKAVSSLGDVLTEATGAPDPVVQFTAFGPSSLDFTVKFWTAEAESASRVKSDVGLAVHAALAAAGIKIPFPQQDVHVMTLPTGSVPEPATLSGDSVSSEVSAPEQ